MKHSREPARHLTTQAAKAKPGNPIYPQAALSIEVTTAKDALLFPNPPTSFTADSLGEMEKVGGRMEEEGTRKRIRSGDDEVACVPVAKTQLSTDASALTTKLAELQAELEASKQSHKVVVDELNAKIDALQAKNESMNFAPQWAEADKENLNAKVDALQSKNETQVSEIKDLTSALQWAYATEGLPRRHWLERGRSWEYADAMGKLLADMKQSIKDLRMGTVNNETGKNIIKIDFNPLEDEEGNHIRAVHDESLMPYWKELAAALKHWSEYHAHGKFLKVEIRYIELPKAVLDILRSAFEQSRICDVFFDRTNSHRNGDMADFVEEVLQSNRLLNVVGIGDIPLTRNDVESICGAIKTRNSGDHFIKCLRMSKCFEDGIDTHTLKTILTSITSGSAEGVTLTSDGNRMSSREAGVIAEFLGSNPSLTQLDLGVNQFDDTDAAVLANALSNNTRLRKIWVDNNAIKENGRFAFLRAVFDVSSLPSCAASNHTCNIDGLERDILVLNSNESPTVNKWSKIFAMLSLSGEDSSMNTALLRGVPTQLIPVILDRVINAWCSDYIQELTAIYLELTSTTRCQKHDVWDRLGETRSINCMYNLMRSWVVPSIFV